jgi:hypothetical protein
MRDFHFYFVKLSRSERKQIEQEGKERCDSSINVPSIDPSYLCLCLGSYSYVIGITFRSFLSASERVLWLDLCVCSEEKKKVEIKRQTYSLTIDSKKEKEKDVTTVIA